MAILWVPMLSLAYTKGNEGEDDPHKFFQRINLRWRGNNPTGGETNMRNKTNGDRRKKSFYIALYAGIGAVMVLALVITFAHWLSVSETQGADYYPHEDDYVPAGAY